MNSADQPEPRFDQGPDQPGYHAWLDQRHQTMRQLARKMGPGIVQGIGDSIQTGLFRKIPSWLLPVLSRAKEPPASVNGQ
jgi:hypothetical protein